jgi:release factor glutamine methyltransferase
VNSHVLSPRPETEELVQQAVTLLATLGVKEPRVVDVGTGSGCIGLSVQLGYPTARVELLDVSPPALQLADRNARLNGVPPSHYGLHKADFLETGIGLQGEQIHAILSNPPYVLPTEANTLHPNVLHHEPHIALFTPNNDPLIFYRKLATEAASRLKPGGFILVELHPDFAHDVAELFRQVGLTDVETRRDQFGRWRFCQAVR